MLNDQRVTGLGDLDLLRSQVRPSGFEERQCCLDHCGLCRDTGGSLQLKIAMENGPFIEDQKKKTW